ncbi:DUF421 domain-containing protein [Actinopolyspora halophila]|uniref:DUF421 domain-containing protein n=1 Tax=Actinopolyspora halophila TaxID=1850 RepID=UPI00036A10F4|nr:YetF domain-containing protein [Actinopolyspora halophila]
MLPEALDTSWKSLALVLLGTVVMYLALILFSRLAGLRSFAQMTNFDMAATVAFGSMVATTAVSGTTPLAQGVLALAVLFSVQGLIAWLRGRRRWEGVVDNWPLLLMEGATVLEESLSRAQLTRNDLLSKLRLAGVTNFDQVGAVVLEASGDVSVLLRESDGSLPEPELLASVRRVPTAEGEKLTRLPPEEADDAPTAGSESKGAEESRGTSSHAEG